MKIDRNLAGNAILIFQALNAQGRTFTSKEYRSYKAGGTFASLFYTAYSDKNMFELYNMMNTFRLNTAYYDALFYRIGFLHRYRDRCFESGNRLPIVTIQVQEEKLAMGKLGNKKAEVRQQSTFIKAEELTGVDALMCITGINKGSGNYGQQWYVHVLLDSSVLGDADATEPTERTVTFSITTNKNDRDRMFEAFVADNDFPIHNVKLEAKPMKNGNSYYDLIEDETAICPCGHVPELEETDETNPF